MCIHKLLIGIYIYMDGFKHDKVDKSRSIHVVK